MELPSIGVAAAVKTVVVTVVALPVLVSSIPAAAPPPRGTIAGQEKPPARGETVEIRPFLIGSVVQPGLFPGATVPVNLTLTNPNSFPLEIQELTVRVERVSVTTATDCDPTNFRTRQFSGGYGVRLDATESTDLRRLGVDPTKWPQLTMLNLPRNQDGCKGAAVDLELRGTAIGTDS